MRDFVPQIAASLREDETWEYDAHYAKNEKLGVSVWIANGFWFVHLLWSAEWRSYGAWSTETKVELSLREKFTIWRAFKALRRNKVQRRNAKLLESIIQRRLTTK